ncbi:unnamed protein product, partial [Acanthoscelides obtectus]
SIFKGTSKEIQNDLLDCILEVCHEEIIKQINRVSYLAIIADETTDISGKTQLVSTKVLSHVVVSIEMKISHTNLKNILFVKWSAEIVTKDNIQLEAVSSFCMYMPAHFDYA